MADAIGIPQDADGRLKQPAAETAHSKEFLTSEIIERGLDDVEDYYLADQVLARIRSGQERVFSSDEVKRDLGLVG